MILRLCQKKKKDYVTVLLNCFNVLVGMMSGFDFRGEEHELKTYK